MASRRALRPGRPHRAAGTATTASCLEMFELEGRAPTRASSTEFLDAIKEAGLTEVWKRITDGYWDISPSGGPRFWWYCEDVCGNTKLAQRPSHSRRAGRQPGRSGQDPDRDERPRRLRRRRADAGTLPRVRQAVDGYGRAARVDRDHHPGGARADLRLRPHVPYGPRWRHPLAQGAGEVRDARRARQARQGQGRDEGSGKTGGKAADKPSTRPGDIYNESGPTWAELLEPHGWRLFQRDADGTEHWTRPGKDRGTSATTGNPQHEGDKLHVFTRRPSSSRMSRTPSSRTTRS